jgi:DNA replication protein DnaC
MPGEVHQGLLFSGVNGCGKTHLATAILHEVLGSDVARSGLFIGFSDYLEALRRSFRRSEGEDAGAPEWVRYSMFQVELLVLDDIGAGGSSRGGWDSEEMHRLLCHRVEAGRPIIATADVGADELAQRLGQRVVSRLYEACQVVSIEAGDFRRRVCGQCRYWSVGTELTSLSTVRLGKRGACTRPEGECQNERGQYQSTDRAPRVRYAQEPAGAHFEKREG